MVSIVRLLVQSAVKKMKNPEKYATELEMDFSKLRPTASQMKLTISDSLRAWIFFLKAISQPYNLMNLIPSIISEQSLILPSLLTLMRRIQSLILREIQQEMGKTTRGTKKVKMPPHPTLKHMMIVAPTRPKGNMSPANMKVSLVSIELKSLLKRFMIFPSYAVLAVKEVSLETFAYMSRMSPARILHEIIGME